MGKRPYVLLSVAMSADGYIDTASGPRLVLSSPEDLDQVDEVRAGCDAIMVGARTIRADDPRLLVKSADRRDRRRVLGLPANPVKVTITGSGNLDPHAAFFADDGTEKLVYAGAAGADELRKRLGTRAVVITLPGDAGLAWTLADLAERAIGRLMIEGGAHLLGQALSDSQADELRLAIAPVFVADPAAPRLLAGAGTTGRMLLAETAQAGDTAVLRYLPGARLAGEQPDAELG